MHYVEFDDCQNDLFEFVFFVVCINIFCVDKYIYILYLYICHMFGFDAYNYTVQLNKFVHLALIWFGSV